MIKYEYSDGGRVWSPHKKDGLSKKQMDCVIRAIAIALEVPYDLVWQWTCPIGYDADDQLKSILDALGRKMEKVQTIKKGQRRRMTAMDMPKEGRFILRLAGHWSALVDGVVKDTWDCRNKCVYYAYQITK